MTMAEENNERELAVGADAQPQAPSPSRRRRLLRPLLLLAGPLLVLAVGVYVYLHSGRYAATENAYVKADRVTLSSRIAGAITQVEVRENQRVAAGEALFVVDPEPYRVALARAEAQAEAVHAFIASLEATYRQRLEELALAHTNATYAERDLEREQALAAQKLSSDETLDEARHEVDIAARRIRIVEQQLAQLVAQLGGKPDGHFSEQPAYVAARAARDSAALDLEHTIVRAPFDGIASKVPLLGQYVVPGGAVMSVIAERDVWIEANYKETDLTYVEVGQPVRIHVDAFPDREWRGAVESISQATGAEFSVIPAQNATGNWVKVTQRIPVRIAVEAAGEPILRAGMSATVEIDTGRERHLPAFLTFGRGAPLPGAAVARE
jgi:membrane fusion protein (multidrug efflux system)